MSTPRNRAYIAISNPSILEDLYAVQTQLENAIPRRKIGLGAVLDYLLQHHRVSENRGVTLGTFRWNLRHGNKKP